MLPHEYMSLIYNQSNTTEQAEWKRRRNRIRHQNQDAAYCFISSLNSPWIRWWWFWPIIMYHNIKSHLWHNQECSKYHQPNHFFLFSKLRLPSKQNSSNWILWRYKCKFIFKICQTVDSQSLSSMLKVFSYTLYPLTLLCEPGIYKYLPYIPSNHLLRLSQFITLN